MNTIYSDQVFKTMYLDVSNHHLRDMMKIQTATAVKKIIKKVDSDGDRKISIKEAMSAMQSEFFKT